MRVITFAMISMTAFALGAPVGSASDDLSKLLGASPKCIQCKLRGAELKGLDLTAVTLAQSDLSHASLKDAILTDAHISQVKLTKADLEDADLAGANISQVKLTDANLKRANLRGAILSQVALEGADLENSDLSDASMNQVSLRGANLKGANLKGVKPYISPRMLEAFDDANVEILRRTLEQHLDRVTEEALTCETTILPNGSFGKGEC